MKSLEDKLEKLAIKEVLDYEGRFLKTGSIHLRRTKHVFATCLEAFIEGYRIADSKSPYTVRELCFFFYQKNIKPHVSFSEEEENIFVTMIAANYRQNYKANN